MPRIVRGAMRVKRGQAGSRRATVKLQGGWKAGAVLTGGCHRDGRWLLMRLNGLWESGGGGYALTWESGTVGSRRRSSSSHQLLGARQDLWKGGGGDIVAKDEAGQGQDERDCRGHEQGWRSWCW